MSAGSQTKRFAALLPGIFLAYFTRIHFHRFYTDIKSVRSENVRHLFFCPGLPRSTVQIVDFLKNVLSGSLIFRMRSYLCAPIFDSTQFFIDKR